MQNEITLPWGPDDWHAHYRSGDMLQAVVPWSARQFKRVVAMGNVPPIDTVEAAQAYNAECNAESGKLGCQTLVSPRLTPETSPDIVAQFHDAGFRHLKLYWGITTGSKTGIGDIGIFKNHFEVMQDLDMVLQIHAENPDPIVDCDQRERSCLGRLGQLVLDFPRLRIVIEHISTAETVSFMERMRDKRYRVAATVTLHHLKHTKNDVRGDLLDPHLICKPEIQGIADHYAIHRAVLIDRLPNIFFGSDSAPHSEDRKGPGKVHNGVFSAPVLMPELLRLFQKHARLADLANFTSAFGADFYELPRNREKLVMVRKPWQVPELVGTVRPYMAGETIDWQVEGFV